MTKAVRLFQGPFGRMYMLDSDHDLVTHAHPQCHILLKVAGADTQYDVRDQRVTLSDDTLVLINAWEPHAKVLPAPGSSTTVLVMCIEPEWLAEHDPLLSSSGLPDFFPHSQITMSPSVRRLVNRLIYDVLSAPAGMPNDAIESSLSDFMLAATYLYAVRRTWVDTYRETLRQRTDGRINRAIAHMRANLDNTLTCEELARAHGLSRQHFFSLFRECTRVSPVIYANTLRMERAFLALGEQSALVNGLADELGFSEPHHFTRFFRRNFGIPPSDYRREVAVIV